jgi:hypothetical protein
MIVCTVGVFTRFAKSDIIGRVRGERFHLCQSQNENGLLLTSEVTTTWDLHSIGNASGVNLILNASRANPIASDVLYSKGVEDITDKVLASLNRGTGVK